jgi:hypothetical protein
MPKQSTSIDTHLAEYDAAARKEYGLEVLPAETADEAAIGELTKIADSINGTIDHITQHEDAFQEATLEPRLLIGQHIARAQEIFILSVTDRTGPATLARRVNVDDTPPADPPSFTLWLKKSTPKLKRTTANKYADAYRSLGLPLDAKVARIRDKINDLRHHAGKNKLPMPSITALARQGKPSAPALPLPKPTEEDIHGEARVVFHEWRETWDNACRDGFLEYLNKTELLDLDEFLKGIRDHLRLRIKSTN